MTNTKHDEEIKELLAYMIKLKDEAKMMLPEFLNSDLHDRRQKYYKTLTLLIENNTKLSNENEELRHDVGSYVKISSEVATENEQLKKTITKMDNDINNAHKDLVEVHDILSDGNSCDFESDIAAALRITVKYSE